MKYIFNIFNIYFDDTVLKLGGPVEKKPFADCIWLLELSKIEWMSFLGSGLGGCQRSCVSWVSVFLPASRREPEL